MIWTPLQFSMMKPWRHIHIHNLLHSHSLRRRQHTILATASQNNTRYLSVDHGWSWVLFSRHLPLVPKCHWSPWEFLICSTHRRSKLSFCFPFSKKLFFHFVNFQPFPIRKFTFMQMDPLWIRQHVQSETVPEECDPSVAFQSDPKPTPRKLGLSLGTWLRPSLAKVQLPSPWSRLPRLPIPCISQISLANACYWDTLVWSVSLGPGHLVVAFFSPLTMAWTNSSAKSRYGTRTLGAGRKNAFQIFHSAKLRPLLETTGLAHNATNCGAMFNPMWLQRTY